MSTTSPAQFIATDYLAGQTAAQIAVARGWTRSKVYALVRQAGVRKGRYGHRRPSESRLAQRAAGYPAWVVRHGTTPCARAVVEALRDGPQSGRELASRLNYAYSTVRMTLMALRRMGQVRSVKRPHWGLA